MKQLLIERFRETICFTYPKDKGKSQMFFTTAICPADMVESLRIDQPPK